MTEARDIYQAHLDVVSRALWDRDFKRITDLKSFPHVMRHPDAQHAFETPDDLTSAMAVFRDRLEGLGATGYHRVCEQACFDPEDGDRLTGSHWTYILRGGNYLSDPYRCEMVLTRPHGIWLTSDIAVPQLRHGIPTPAATPPRGIGPLQ